MAKHTRNFLLLLCAALAPWAATCCFAEPAHRAGFHHAHRMGKRHLYDGPWLDRRIIERNVPIGHWLVGDTGGAPGSLANLQHWQAADALADIQTDITAGLASPGSDIEQPSLLSAGKVWRLGASGSSAWVHTSMRYTQPNQFGILGFNAARTDTRCVFCFETRAAFLSDDFMTGVEISHHPNLVNGFENTSTYDAYIAWVPRKHLSITGAYVNYGDIAGRPNVQGPYLSLKFDLGR